uniref:3-oxo-5-alpha-steroid 4-dehydrogenase n=1 Tax=Erpetoichthys calabaricus TaxID=27687 RepID=A0A8C4XAL8_ERPCA
MDGLFSPYLNDVREYFILECMSYLLIVMGVTAFVVLFFVNAPYGRYTSSTFGFPIRARVAWFIQELPALLVPLWLLLFSSPGRIAYLPNQVLIAMYLCHYVHRTLIYPFLIQGGKPTPFIPFALAFVFCTYNGYLQTRHLSHFAVFPRDWITSPCFIIGFILWLAGMIINVHSDQVLRNLRKPGETGYKIPRGGLFEYVSGANFTGEILEWTGFAIAAWSLESAAFAVFTFLVLSSRASQHHRWYKEKFEDYPKTRKALLPFVF